MKKILLSTFFALACGVFAQASAEEAAVQTEGQEAAAEAAVQPEGQETVPAAEEKAEEKAAQ